MIYAIHPDTECCLVPHIDSKEARRTLGQDTLFHYDLSPVAYAQQWTPVEIEYYEESGTKVPHIGMADGRLFLNTTAYQALRKLLEPFGECLPATFQHQPIFIFNILNIAEQAGVLDHSACTRDAHGHLERIAFHADRFNDNAIYRADWDHWEGIYCGEVFKHAVEQHGLTGLIFTDNLSIVPMP